MFKRISCLVLAMAMVISFSACKENTSDGSEYEIIEEVIVQGGEESTTAATESTQSGTTSTVTSTVVVSGSKGNSGTTSTGTQSTVTSTSESTTETTSSQVTSSAEVSSTDTGSVAVSETNTDSDTPAIGDTEAWKEWLDFGGATVTLMREWEPYPNGKNAAWDNFNAHLAKTEKKFNVKIEEKKWKATLANEMLSGVKPEGNLYLVGATGGGNIYDMATKGYLADLNDAMTKTGITMEEDIYSEFNTGVGNLNGKQWTIGVGFSRISAAVVYNKKLLAEVGYKKTVSSDTSVQGYIDSNKWTWDTMTEMAKKVTKRNASGEVTQWGIGIGSIGINGMIVSNGGHVVYPNSKGKFTSTLNTENVKEALQQVYDWYHVDKVASAFSGGQWTSMGTAFTEKKVAFVFGGHNEASTPSSKMQADDYGIAYLPMGPRAKKYTALMTYEYCYVVPAAYQNMTTELLLLADELHQWPVEGYTRDDEFRDEWTRYFLASDQYTMWRNMHFSDAVQRTWEPAAIINSGADFSSIISGEQTPAVWVDSNHSTVSQRAADISSKYTYTGNLK